MSRVEQEGAEAAEGLFFISADWLGKAVAGSISILCDLHCIPLEKLIALRFALIHNPGMHPLFTKANSLTQHVIAAAIEVHRDKGPGLLEPIYEWCLLRELELRGINTSSQKVVRIEYKGFTREEPLRFDVLVAGCLLVEAKAVEKVLPIHKAQLLGYMKLLNVPLGLVINFHETKLVDGVRRMILPGADS